MHPTPADEIIPRACYVKARGVAVGETQNQPFQFSFNSSLKVDFQGSAVTSDGGLVLVRELDERLGFGELIERHLADARGKNTELPL